MGRGKEAANVAAVWWVRVRGGVLRWSIPSKAAAATLKTLRSSIALMRLHIVGGDDVASTWRVGPGKKSSARICSHAVGLKVSGVL